jgi:Tfp pilus assembly protein PilX
LASVSPLNSECGLVLFTALLFVLIMSILGAIAYIITSNDSAIAVNLEVSRKAFYSAESGVNFALKSIETDLKTHTIDMIKNEYNIKTISYFTFKYVFVPILCL